MSVHWPFATNAIQLQGTGTRQISTADANRQETTAKEILLEFERRPGIMLADEVGMGKTYVALAAAASIILATRGQRGPVVVMVPSRLRDKWRTEWDQFRRHCSLDKSLGQIRSKSVDSPTEFFKALQGKSGRRTHLVFLTTGCFSEGPSGSLDEAGDDPARPSQDPSPLGHSP